MLEFDQNWFYEGPVDYEFKRYTLLAKTKRLRALIERNVLWPVILEIEDQLDQLYSFKYQKEVLDDRLRVAKDIDFINFQIIYEIPESVQNEQMEILHQVANDAITEFEDIYMDARLKWRDIEREFKLTWVPERPLILNEGYVAIIENKKYIRLFKFPKLTKLSGDWRTFSFEKVDEAEYVDVSSLSDLRQKWVVDQRGIMFCRIDYVPPVPFEDTVVPIIRSIIYSSLMRDFSS